MNRICELALSDPPPDSERSRDLHANYPALSRFVQSKLPPELRRLTDADDILQETFIEAWRYGASSYGAHVSATSIVWLRTVAKRKIIDWVRHRGARKRASDNNEPLAIHDCSESASTPAPGSDLEKQEAERILLDALEQLSPRHRMVIRLRFFEQLSFEGVAQELDVSTKAAQMLVKRATVRLKRIIGRQSRVM